MREDGLSHLTKLVSGETRENLNAREARSCRRAELFKQLYLGPTATSVKAGSSDPPPSRRLLLVTVPLNCGLLTMNFLQIIPSSEIRFAAALTDGTSSEAEIHLVNLCGDRVLYKIKTNNLRSYHVKVPTGVIEPRDRVTVLAQLKAGRTCQEDDKILIIAGRAKRDEDVPSSIGQWLSKHPSSVYSHKLLCLGVQQSPQAPPNLSSSARESKQPPLQNEVEPADETKEPVQTFRDHQVTHDQERVADYLRVFPETELIFSNTSRTASIHVENLGFNRAAFKLRTTNRESYLVCTPRGIIEPGGSIEIMIRLKVDHVCRSHDLFMLLVVLMDPDMSHNTLEQLFRTTSPEISATYKFWCTWVNVPREELPDVESEIFKKDQENEALKKENEYLQRIIENNRKIQMKWVKRARFAVFGILVASIAFYLSNFYQEEEKVKTYTFWPFY